MFGRTVPRGRERGHSNAQNGYYHVTTDDEVGGRSRWGGLTGLQLLLVGFVRHLAHVDRHCGFDVCLSLFHPVMENLEELLRLVVTHHQFVEGVLQERGTLTLSPHLQQEEYTFAVMGGSVLQA